MLAGVCEACRARAECRRARASPARGEATHTRSDRSPPAAPRPSSLKGANPKTQKSQMRFHLRPTAERRCDLYPTPRYPNPNPNPNRSTPAVLCYLMVLYSAVLSGLPVLRNTGGSCRRVPPERARWLGHRRPAGERGWGGAARTHTQGQMGRSDLSGGAAARPRDARSAGNDRTVPRPPPTDGVRPRALASAVVQPMQRQSAARTNSCSPKIRERSSAFSSVLMKEIYICV